MRLGWGSALALLAAQLQLRNRTWHRFRNECIEARHQIERATYPYQICQLRDATGLNTLNGTFGNARFGCQFSLREVALEPCASQALSKLAQDYLIHKLVGDPHNPSIVANNTNILTLIAILDELMRKNDIRQFWRISS